MIATAELTPEAIRDADNRYIQSLLETIRHLESKQGQECVNGYYAKQYSRCLKHRDDLGEWLVDQATKDGKQTKFTIDASLGGEDFVPGSFTRIVNGKKYSFELVSTVYKISEET